MIISDDLITYLASLSKIELSNTELEHMKTELNKLVEYMNLIDSVDTSSVEGAVNESLLSNVFRDDVVIPSYDRETILSAACAKNDEAFVVPKTVE